MSYIAVDYHSYLTLQRVLQLMVYIIIQNVASNERLFPYVSGVHCVRRDRRFPGHLLLRSGLRDRRCVCTQQPTQRHHRCLHGKISSGQYYDECFVIVFFLCQSVLGGGGRGVVECPIACAWTHTRAHSHARIHIHARVRACVVVKSFPYTPCPLYKFP